MEAKLTINTKTTDMIVENDLGSYRYCHLSAGDKKITMELLLRLGTVEIEGITLNTDQRRMLIKFLKQKDK